MEGAAIRLKRLREQATPKLSIRRIAQFLDIPPSSYAFYEDPKKFKKQYLPVEFAKLISEPLTGYGIDMWDVLALAGLEERHDLIDANPVRESAERVDDIELVDIASVDQDYGLGAVFVGDRIEVDVLRFPKSWIQQLTHSDPAALTWARGRGDSMAPTINDNDIVLIDRSERSVRDQDLIWCFTIGDIGMIKRLRVRGRTVTILSDNSDVSDDTADADEINIIGRITRVVKPV